MDTESSLKPTLPSSWVEFFQNVITVAKATGRNRDEVTIEMYIPEVSAKLGPMVTPPWHL